MNRKLIYGVFIFVAGIIINEILLMVQGIAALDYISFSNMDVMLLGAAIILFIGILLMFIGSIGNRQSAIGNRPGP